MICSLQENLQNQRMGLILIPLIRLMKQNIAKVVFPPAKLMLIKLLLQQKVAYENFWERGKGKPTPNEGNIYIVLPGLLKERAREFAVIESWMVVSPFVNQEI
ncbi:MAG: hypothetical protein CM1200mP10_24180 [Candidatus Neomarinimicrobiota bacterium]|nr:MAG: hypothetical protein CM1200mP10_24180 [Candidatus Neomarinimicrobiota bacterium]